VRIVRLGNVSRVELRLAEKLDVVGKHCFARLEIDEPSRHPDFVALEDSRIALDRFHQRAGFALLGGRTLPEAATAQARAKLVDAVAGPEKLC